VDGLVILTPCYNAFTILVAASLLILPLTIPLLSILLLSILLLVRLLLMIVSPAVLPLQIRKMEREYSDGPSPGLNVYQPDKDDILIAVMGITGTGKSTFINHCTDTEVSIGDNLHSGRSCSPAKVQMAKAARIIHHELSNIKPPLNRAKTTSLSMSQC
jgi:hypothetical protein